ncbi:15577_t:CDS:2 [Acaulospora morrowiae]|uniref:15577_t:CDS:1 n=1 Tax=Acaulospora morrowiae TaxID=94023 RepID=A0A9N9FQ77_9GLOM|nr:15577_t:CDS:2 [Acaulospora morrowiae]
MTENKENKTSPVRRRVRTAIKRPLPLSAQKNQESAGRKRRAVAATPKNIGQALNGGAIVQLDVEGSDTVEGQNTQSKITEAAPKETPSKMLRKLSRALVQGKQTSRKCNSTPRKPRTRQTPNTARFTPSSTRRSSRRQNNKNSGTKIKKKITPQDLLRELSRAPGFVQKPVEHEIKDADVIPDQIESQPEDKISRQEDDITENELDTEVQRRMIPYDSDDDFSKVFGDQITETIEFTGEVIDDFDEVIPIRSSEKKCVVDEHDSPVAVDELSSRVDAELDFWMGRNSDKALNAPLEDAASTKSLGPFNKLLSELMKESLEESQSSPSNKIVKLDNELFIRDPIQDRPGEDETKNVRRTLVIKDPGQSDIIINDDRDSPLVEYQEYEEDDVQMEYDGDELECQLESDSEKENGQTNLDGDELEGQLESDSEKENGQDDVQTNLDGDELEYQLGSDSEKENEKDKIVEVVHQSDSDSDTDSEQKNDNDGNQRECDDDEIEMDCQPESSEENNGMQYQCLLDNEFGNMLVPRLFTGAEVKDIQGKSKKRRSRVPKSKGQPHLPYNLVKKIFSNFSMNKVSSDAMQTIFEGTHLFLEQVADDLATYATHGKREVIKEKDVILLMKRQKLITNKVSFESLAERYLPRELSEEICQVAKAGNSLFPPDKSQKKSRRKR